MLSAILLLVASATFSTAQFESLVLDRFEAADVNAQGNWHGCDEGEGITCTWTPGALTVLATDTDFNVYTQFTNGCQDISALNNQFLHLRIQGSNDFTIALQQNNPTCNEAIAPFPATWDVVYAADYADIFGDVYVPISHFNINKRLAIGFSFKAFRSPFFSTTFNLVEIVPFAPFGRIIPAKKATGVLSFGCTRPNSIAFAIDEGEPEFAQEAWQHIKDSGIKATFFTVGNTLADSASNFTNLYKEALSLGHQVALHSYTHGKMESMLDFGIELEFNQSLQVARQQLGNQVSTKYFRPPYGTDGARTRQMLERLVGGNSKVINWSIDVEDWIWGNTTTPENQLEAVRRDLEKGGTIFVSHYLFQSTVDYIPQFIAMAKATGKQMMRVDQCMQDPLAPPITVG